MLDRPTTLTVSERREFDRRARDLEIRVLENVEELVATVDSDELAEELSTVAFQPNETLPKRRERPKLEQVLLVSELYGCYGEDDAVLDRLIKLAVVQVEYFDVTDDLFDGDVPPASRRRALLCQQLLVPILSDLLAQLGPDVADYWRDQTNRMLKGCLAELRTSEPDYDDYRELLDRQAELFGSLTGATALAADRPDAVSEFEAVGKTYFSFEQVLLDGFQHRLDPGDTWNAWRFLDDDEALELLASCRTEARSLTDDLPPEARQAIRALFAVDLDAWLETLDES